MMNPIVEENLVTFKEMEQIIYTWICELGRAITRIILEEFDDELAKGRDKKTHRDKGKRVTSIKTVYGEVTYMRRVYKTKSPEGFTMYVYLLDQAIKLDRIGLISVNLAEMIADSVTVNTFRKGAKAISQTTGQTISHGGAWKLVQKLGERVTEEEEAEVSKFNAGEVSGSRNIDVLFEEMDGVWLKMQGPDHKRAPKQEMKVSTIYEGWDREKPNNLVGKKVLAGMETSDKFHDKREAQIESIYDVSSIKYRILNGDGGSWIKDTYEPKTVFQLDAFHIRQEIKRKLNIDEVARKEVERLYNAKKIDEMLSFIRIYADSVDTNDKNDTRAKKARELLSYLSNNYEGLKSYKDRIADLPAPPKGVIYKNMGVQENQNCTVITLRMKGKRKRWSTKGANNMAKLLYRKENHELSKTVNRYCENIIFILRLTEIAKGLTGAEALREPGKRDAYYDKINMHVPMRDAAMTASRRALLKALF